MQHAAVRMTPAVNMNMNTKNMQHAHIVSMCANSVLRRNIQYHVQQYIRHSCTITALPEHEHEYMHAQLLPWK